MNLITVSSQFVWRRNRGASVPNGILAKNARAHVFHSISLFSVPFAYISIWLVDPVSMLFISNQTNGHFKYTYLSYAKAIYYGSAAICSERLSDSRAERRDVQELMGWREKRICLMKIRESLWWDQIFHFISQLVGSRACTYWRVHIIRAADMYKGVTKPLRMNKCFACRKWI